MVKLINYIKQWWNDHTNGINYEPIPIKAPHPQTSFTVIRQWDQWRQIRCNQCDFVFHILMNHVNEKVCPSCEGVGR